MGNRDSFDEYLASWDDTPVPSEETAYVVLNEQNAAAYEALANLEVLQNDPLEIAGVRYVQFEDARGREVELLAIGRGRTLRALAVHSGELQTSTRCHPNRRSIGLLGSGIPIKPDVIAHELLFDLPEEERTADVLLERARNNWRLRRACERIIQAVLTSGKLTVGAFR